MILNILVALCVSISVFFMMVDNYSGSDAKIDRIWNWINRDRHGYEFLDTMLLKTGIYIITLVVIGVKLATLSDPL